MSKENQIVIIKKVLELLEKGDKEIILDQHKDIVLVLGNTGSGKSTFVQYLSRNESLKSISKLGSFIIEGNRIQGGTTSETIFPELILGGENAYYDCPGFEDNRGIDKDIAGTYFIKKVVDHAEKLKIILTVDSSFITSRDEFSKLVKHTSSFIKDITKFEKSIMLIITKADTGTLTEEEYIKGISKWLIDNVKTKSEKQLEEPNLSSQEQKLHHDTINLMNALLDQKEGHYIKLGLFKKPKQAGKLFEIDSFEQERRALVDTLGEDIQFVVKNDDDFGFTISDESKNKINDLNAEINEQIKQSLAELGKDLQKYFKTQIQNSNDIYKLKDDLKNINFIGLKEDVIHLKDPKEIVQRISNELDKLQISLPIWSEERSKTILKYGSYLEFLRTVKPEVTTAPEKWAGSFDGLIQYLNDSKQWYQFLVALHVKLSEYEIQKDRKKYNVTDIKDWGQGNQEENGSLRISINKDNFKQFLEEVKKRFFEYDYITDMQDDCLRIIELNQLLKITLTPSLERIGPAHDKNLTVKGDYIKLSEVEKFFNAASSDIKSIKIFGLNTLFIDADIDLQGIPVTFIAPRWEVRRDRARYNINLSGAPNNYYISKAEDGEGNGDNSIVLQGKDGKPGLPGGTAGSFLGIGREMIDIDRLIITADGGTGGVGQHGGDGGKGKDGVKANMPSGNTINREMIPDGHDEQNDMFNKIKSDFYIINSQPGVAGGDGGMGGQGGNGGQNGTIYRINVSEKNKPTILVSKPGDVGAGGRGGRGGEGGKNENSIRVSYNYVSTWNGKSYEKSEGWSGKKEDKPPSIERASPGKDGKDNSNTQGIQQPNPRFDCSGFAIDINDYKSYLRENLNDRFKQGPLITFCQELDRHPTVQSIYNTLGLFNELQSLENQFFTLAYTHKVNCLPFYESLLERVREYVTPDSNKQYANPYANEELISAKDNKAYKKALSYLYTTILSKIWSLKSPMASYLIVDIREYLNSVEESINLLKEKEEQVAINKYKNDYKIIVDNKIEEAITFIENCITPEIDRINDQIDKKVEALIAETVKLKEDAIKNMEALVNQQEELRKTLMLRGIFGFLKVGSQIASFVGPVGATMSAAIGGSTMIAESFILDDKTYEGKPFSLPPGIKFSLQKIETRLNDKKNDKVSIINQQLEEISGIHPEKLADIKEKINDIKQKLADESAREADFDPASVDNLQAELKQVLKKKEEALKKEGSNADQKTKDALKVVDHINNTFRIFELGVDVYNKYKNDKQKLDAISSAIEKADADIKRLKEYEDKIYQAIIPMVKGMRDDIVKVENTLQGKSHTALDVTKWLVQSSIRDIRSQLQQVTKGFEVQEDLARCIEKLDESMTTLINVYDRIQSYQDQEELAQYIANIRSPDANSIGIKDNALKEAITQLERINQLNIVLGQFESAMQAFEQWMFPFSLSQKDYQLPKSLASADSTLQDTKTGAIRQIENMSSEVKVYYTSITEHDSTVKEGEFYESDSSYPFTVWRNKEYQKEISALLEGKIVTLKADISSSDSKKSAIKFNKIGIYLRATDPDIQAEMEKKLAPYEVNMTHLGNSYYRWKNKYTVITGKEQLITYYFEKQANGEPFGSNIVYKKLALGDFMLSPYTMWNIQLKDNKKIGYNSLKAYKDKVDLQLVGHGKWVDESK